MENPIYKHKDSGKFYALDQDGVRLDLSTELTTDITKYKRRGGNNIFDVYILKAQPKKKL